jgi:hypothetical protein
MKCLRSLEEDENYALWAESMGKFDSKGIEPGHDLVLETETHGSRFRPHRNPLTENYGELRAEFLVDAKGNNLLYPGTITLLYGKPGTFKSWIALSLIGRTDVRYWDFENLGPILAKRLRLMGVDAKDASVFDYPQSRAEIYERISEYLIDTPKVLVIDGMSGLARTMGVNSDANDQVETLYEKVLFPLKRAGVSVLLLDHTPKEGSMDDFPIGAQSKKSQCDVAILCKGRRESQEIDVYSNKGSRNDELFFSMRKWADT